MVCPLCQRRKARRHCPALDRRICAVCCGTKRLVEIQCPADCGYLSSSRAHPPAAVQRQQQRDFALLAPTLQGLTEPQSRLLLLAGGFIAQYQPPDLHTVRDEDVAEAASSLASTLETADRGIIYEHHAQSRVARALANELRQVFLEAEREPAAGPSLDVNPGAEGRIRRTRDAAAVLRCLERGAREVARAEARAGTEPPPTAYCDLLRRVFRTTAAADPSRETPPRGGDLVMP